MADSEEERTVTDWRTESRFYRRKPGAGWLVAFLAVPVLLAVIGGGGLARSGDADTLTLPTVNPTATLTATAAAPAPETPAAAAPVGDYPTWSIVRNGNEFRITGEVPDQETKTGLIDTLRMVLAGARIVDELTVTPGVRMADVAGLGGLFSAAVGIPDFNLSLAGGTVTLTGNAPDEGIKASAETYTTTAFPDVNVVNDIQVVGAAPPAPSPAPPAPGGGCATLQSDITGLLKTPITFGTAGATLAVESQRLVGQIADRVKGCPDAKLTVTGHTDGTGSDAINRPLSANRAKAVADALVADGVPAANVTSTGVGAAQPIASDGTAEGRAQNRRVEITVS